VVYRQEGIEKNVKVAVVVYKLCIAYQYYASHGRSAGVKCFQFESRHVGPSIMGGGPRTRMSNKSKLPTEQTAHAK